MTVLGIDLGASKLLAVTGGAAGFRVRRDTGRGLGPDEAIEAIADVVERARDQVAVHAVGVGFPGLVDHARGLVRSSVMLEGWRDVPLAARLEDRLGVPCAIDNDVNAAALWELGCRGAPDFLFVAVGTGIGGALALGGRLHRGASGLAGEIGHVVTDREGIPCTCGRRGCVNRRASGAAIEAAAGLPAGALREASDLRPGRGGLAALERAVADGAAALGAAIGDALNLLDLPLVVVGGGIAELGPSYVAAVAAAARLQCFGEIGGACAFEVARGGYDGAARGAAELAGQRLAGQPDSSATWPSASA